MAKLGYVAVALTIFLLAGIILQPFLGSLVPMVPRAYAASNLVCIGPSGSNVCPTSPPQFSNKNYPNMVELAVNVENSSPFNGFDIALKADPTILNGTSILNVGDAFRNAGGSVFIGSECINGHPIQGNCTSQDGSGVVHVVAASNVPVTGGHLFNVTYHIIGTGTIPIAYQTGCTNTSNGSNCVTLVNAATTISENIQAAIFSNAPPDFTISASPSTLRIAAGNFGTSQITLTSNGFSGTISLSSTVAPNTPTITIPLKPPTFALVSGGTGTSVLNVTTTPFTPLGIYTVTVTGSSGALSHSTTVSVTVYSSTVGGTSLANQPASPLSFMGFAAIVLAILVVGLAGIYTRRRTTPAIVSLA